MKSSNNLFLPSKFYLLMAVSFLLFIKLIQKKDIGPIKILTSKNAKLGLGEKKIQKRLVC